MTFAPRQRQGADKPKAVVIKTFTHENLLFNLTEKCAVSIYYRNAEGREVFSHALPPTAVEMHASFGCPIMSSIVNDPIWEQAQNGKARTKQSELLTKQVEVAQKKGIDLGQAAIDQLKATGMSDEQARRTLAERFKVG